MRNTKKDKWNDCAAHGGSLQPRGRSGKRADGPWHSNSTNKRGHQHVKTRMRRSQKRALRRVDEKQARSDE